MEECLGNSQADYTYFGAGDDAGCPASMQMALRNLKGAKSPLIASDFYVVHMESRSSVYVEAVLLAQWMTGETISQQDLEKTLQEGTEGAYIATHAALAPTRDLVAAGGFPEAMKWHYDWFSYHVAALRAGLRYVSVPLACWRQSPAGYSHAARSG